MKLFVGSDVSLSNERWLKRALGTALKRDRSTSICVISEHGRIIEVAETESDPEVPVHWLVESDGSITAIGLEAGPPSQWLHQGLTEAGLDAVLMKTLQVKGTLKAIPIKADRRDAEGIRRLLHLGWFRPVHHKSVSAQEVRAVHSARKTIQQGMIALEMSLRGLLRNFGLKVGVISLGRFEARIRELTDGNPMLETATAPMLRARAPLRQELGGFEKRLRQLAGDDSVCRRLMTMPGIGGVVALIFHAAVDDPANFGIQRGLVLGLA